MKFGRSWPLIRSDGFIRWPRISYSNIRINPDACYGRDGIIEVYQTAFGGF